MNMFRVTATEREPYISVKTTLNEKVIVDNGTFIMTSVYNSKRINNTITLVKREAFAS